MDWDHRSKTIQPASISTNKWTEISTTTQQIWINKTILIWLFPNSHNKTTITRKCSKWANNVIWIDSLLSKLISRWATPYLKLKDISLNISSKMVGFKKTLIILTLITTKSVVAAQSSSSISNNSSSSNKCHTSRRSSHHKCPLLLHHRRWMRSIW